MELSSPSSAARQTRLLGSPGAVSSSDAGEREEAMSWRPDYWSTDVPERAPFSSSSAQVAIVDASPEAVGSPTGRRCSPQYSAGRPSPFLSPAAASEPSPPRSPFLSPVTGSFRHRSPSTTLGPRPPPPARPRTLLGTSDDDVELVSARRSSPILSSPAHSSPAPATERDTGRSFRNRTAAQLNPYSIEQAKYTRTLLRNGWQGAVVAGPRRGEETADELRRKKLAAAQAPKDDLGGWLEYEEGQPIARGRGPSSPAAELSDDSVDGEDLLRREARRRERMARDVDAALVGVTRQRPRVESDDESDPGRPVRPPPVYRVPGKAKKSRAAKGPSSRAASDGEGTSRRKGNTSRHPRRADSEPPTSSPSSQHDRASASRSRKRKTAAPSKSIHARQFGPRSDLHSQLLAISGPSSSPVRIDLTRSESDDSMAEEESDEEAEEEDEDVIAERKRARMDLAGKRKRALGMMMPAVFMKKAQADLRLMEREKRAGVASGSDAGSGDEDRASDDSEERNRHRAKIRTVPRLLDQPLAFDGETFTDESGDEGRELEPSSPELEGDAVSTWIHSFAPRRNKKGEDDLVDRFLKRSRGPSLTKTAKSKSARARQASSKADQDRGRGRQEGTRPRLHEKQNTLHDSTRRAPLSAKQGDVAIKRSRPIAPKAQVIPLDTDTALFHHASMDKPTARRPLPPPAAPSHPLSRSEDNEHWASFGKFSPDWDIQRLPVGAQFAPRSFVQRGHLFSLLNPASAPTPLRSVLPFDIPLLSTASLEDIEGALPIVCDATFDHLARPDDARMDRTGDEDGAHGEAMRFLGAYVSEYLPVAPQDARRRLAGAIRSQLDRLGERLAALQLDRRASKSLERVRVNLAWYTLDLYVRLVPIDSALDPGSVRRQAASLVRLLVEHGVEQTTKAIKSLSDVEPINLVVDDCSVDAWLGLISLATAELGKSVGFEEEELWRMVSEETVKTLPTTTTTGPLTGEILSYTAMMLCAISQFSPSGLSTSSPRLASCWSTVTRALEPIQPAALSRSDHTLSNTAVARRDRYLRTLFSRCLVFVERWGWQLDGREDLLPKLFDLVNARHLQDLTIESSSDFPPFLQDLDHFGASPLDRQIDTAFTTFLKLVIHAAQNVPSKNEADRRRQLTRLFLRLAPINSGPWTRRSPELAGAGSALINHFSLYLTFAMLSPTTASQRLDQAKRLISFAEVDQSARTICIRAVLYFALLYRRHHLPLAPVVDWLASIALQLRTEHAQIEKERHRERGATDARGGNKTSLVRQHDSVSLLLMMVLRSVQLVLQAEEGQSALVFPDIALLQPAWTSQLLDSTMALDPIVGSEVVQTISLFLDRRRAALPRRREEEVAGASQDDFGMFDLDFADPAFDAMLGVEPAAPVVAPQAQLKVQDRSFAELIRDQLSPAFFRLVSNILVAEYSDRSSLTVADRNAYAQQVVECWTRLLTVMIENDVAEWTPYLRYGDHSWKRISDPLGRRDIGLLLAIQILAHDSDVFPLFRDEFLEIWCQSIVSRKLTAQHALTSALLNVERPAPLFETLPFDRSGVTGRFEVLIDELELRRVEVLRATFEQACKILKPTGLLQAQQSISRATILNLIRGMLAAMRDNLAAIPDELSRRVYASFCREVLEALRGCGAAELNEQSLPDMRTLATATSV